MTVSGRTKIAVLLVLVSALLASSCKKQVAAAPPPPPPPVAPTPPPPAPTITLRAQPATIDRGQAATLQWEARNAANVQIEPGLGAVTATGNRAVNPTSSVTYTARATGPGGEATDTARVTVNIPPTPPPPPPPRPPAPPVVRMDDLFRDNVLDVFFDYDKADIRPSDMSTLQKNAAFLRQNGNVRFTIEGHCDERGSAEYNLGLGDRRANAAKEFLVQQGIQASRINVISYGEEKPICREQNEDCYMKNRRAHFTYNP
ncbi:MAG TPA: peptidoglycan-associated lipoprotein Pal [Terriglobia bacterium]|nr:peptidoglycan-associated lipoprotein Pal [Terriglobia bacterium]